MARFRQTRNLVARAIRWWIVGAIVTLVFGVLMWWFADPTTLVFGWGGQTSVGSRVTPHGVWIVTVHERPGAWLLVSETERLRKRNWGPEQACGPPDTADVGDYPTAWASATPDGGPEWLELGYVTALVPARVQIHETFSPGAVRRVSAFRADGAEVTLWEGRDGPRPPSDPRVLDLPIAAGFATTRLRVYLDSLAVPSWNEIDAVAIVSADGETQWAEQADASSTYAHPSGYRAVAKPEQLVPSWTGMLGVDREAHSGIAVAFGWPWPALGLVLSLKPQASISPGPLGPKGAPLPTRVLWSGLAADAAIVGFALWAIAQVFIRPSRILREALRMRRGRCPKCAYDLRFDFVQGCPECGFRRAT
jgi:hypothetical protein